MEYPVYVSTEVSAREVIEVLRRRRWTVLITLALFLLLAAGITPRITPVYQANATMVVEQAPVTVAKGEPFVDRLMAPAQPYSVDTQVEMLESGPLQARVIKQLGALPSDEYPSLTVARIGETEVIRVLAESTEPRVAQKAANALVDEYIRQTMDESGTTVRRTRKFVEQRLTEAHKQLADVDARLRRFQEQHRVPNLPNNRDSAIQAANSIQEELRKNENELASLTSQVRLVRAQVAREPVMVEGGHTLTPNPKVEALQDDIRRLELQRITLLRTLRPTEPEVQAVDRQIARLRRELARLPRTVRNEVTWLPNPARATLQGQLDALGVQMRGLEPQVRRLQAQYNAAQLRLTVFPAWESRLLQLQRERDQAQEHFKALSNQHRELQIQEQAAVVPAQPLTRAGLPGSPVRPQPTLNLLAAAALGLVFGIGAACLREMTDSHLHAAEEAERIMGLPILGRVPTFPRRTPQLIPAHGESLVKDSYRRLRFRIMCAPATERVRTLMITSAAAHEGKSTNAVNLALAVALQGRRVILVDADLRDPSLSALLGVEPRVGLTEVLAGEVSLLDALYPTETEHLLLVPAGMPRSNAPELLAGPRLPELVQQLSKLADLVVFDSPPCLPVADAEVLGAQVDAAVLVVGLGRAQKGAVRMARALLDQAGVRVLGGILNRVRPGDQGYSYDYHSLRSGASLGVPAGPAALAPRTPEVAAPAHPQPEEAAL
jgi:polysaccharide biosynthesis transport protein